MYYNSVNNSCLLECEDGYKKTILKAGETDLLICTPCDDNCKTCESRVPPLKDKCTTCKENMYLYEDLCVLTCPPNYYKYKER